jgi:hypothetical protein
VTPKISIPVGFVFYQPDPELSAWYQREKALKKQKVPKAQRPPKPAPNPQYPTKQRLALRLLEAFQAHYPDIRVHLIAADALYGTAPFVDAASALFGGVQVPSQIRSNQNIRIGKREQHVCDYFATHPARQSASASEALKRSWRWSAVPEYASAYSTEFCHLIRRKVATEST